MFLLILTPKQVILILNCFFFFSIVNFLYLFSSPLLRLYPNRFSKHNFPLPKNQHLNPLDPGVSLLTTGPKSGHQAYMNCNMPWCVTCQHDPHEHLPLFPCYCLFLCKHFCFFCQGLYLLLIYCIKMVIDIFPCTDSLSYLQVVINSVQLQVKFG